MIGCHFLFLESEIKFYSRADYFKYKGNILL